MRGVREATPLAPTESLRARTQPIDTYRTTFQGADSVLDRSCYLSHSTDSLQIQGWPPPPPSVGAVLSITSVKTREPPAPRGTRVGCKFTRVTEEAAVYRPLYMFRP